MKTCSKRKQRGDRFRNFKDFYNDLVDECGQDISALNVGANAWNYQQKYIELLETKIRGLRKEIS